MSIRSNQTSRVMKLITDNVADYNYDYIAWITDYDYPCPEYIYTLNLYMQCYRDNKMCCVF